MRQSKVATDMPTDRLPRVGLARRLSKLGFCSRMQGFELVRSGRVAINGKTHRNPEYPVSASDAITVDDHRVTASTKLYLMMNKPRGLVTTASDDKGRPTVYSLLGSQLPWVAPVGRLDQASEALLLFTNDSDWAASITSPENHIDKTYHLQVRAVAHQLLLTALGEGVEDKGEILQARRVSFLRGGRKNSWLEIALDEGRNRHIRRMLIAHRVEVLRLVRISIGPLALGKLAKGEVRPLTLAEKEMMDCLLGALPPNTDQPVTRAKRNRTSRR